MYDKMRAKYLPIARPVPIGWPVDLSTTFMLSARFPGVAPLPSMIAK